MSCLVAGVQKIVPPKSVRAKFADIRHDRYGRALRRPLRYRAAESEEAASFSARTVGGLPLIQAAIDVKMPVAEGQECFACR